jgi:hypothetical protein
MIWYIKAEKIKSDAIAIPGKGRENRPIFGKGTFGFAF